LWSLGAAVPAWAQSLTDVLATTYSTNPELMAGRAELRATNELVPQALSGWRPTIAGTASIGRTWIDSEVGSDATNPRTVGLSLSQPVYRGGRTVSATREAENLVLAQRARLVGVEQEVLLDAAAAYMDVVRDAAVLELNVNNQQVLTRQLEAAQDRFEVGEITRTDVAQSEARLAGANAGRIAAEGDLTESRARFVQVVGEAPGTLETPPILATLPGSLEEAIEVAVNANPNVVAADYVERAARDGVDVVFGELLPSIALQGDVEYGEEQSTFADDRTTATVEAQVGAALSGGRGLLARARGEETRQPTAAGNGAATAQCRPDRDDRLGSPFDRPRADRRLRGAGALGRDRARGRARGGAGRLAHHPRRARCRAGAVGCAGQPRSRKARRDRRRLPAPGRRRQPDGARPRFAGRILRLPGRLPGSAQQALGSFGKRGMTESIPVLLCTNNSGSV
jgi:TolC family type I secretion outer membrane protein